MTTLKDISKATGVSVTQVSRALGGHDDVSADTRDKVQAAAAELGYRPNTMARGLKTGRSGLVALVVPADIDAFSKEIMFEMVMGISQEISRRDLCMVFHVTETGSDPLQIYDQLYDGGGMDGFIVVDPKIGDARIAHLLARKIPHVVHGRDPSQAHPFVDIDNTGIAARMVRALVAAGHHRIAFINGPGERAFARARAAGFRAAVEAAGIAGTCEIIFGPMTRSFGATQAGMLMARETPPTAILAGNMMLARGVYGAARMAGLDIPRDLSVLAHDDALSRFPRAEFSPVLGGTRSALPAAWQEIARLLSEAIGEGVAAAQGVSLTADYQPGASLAPPRTHDTLPVPATGE